MFLVSVYSLFIRLIYSVTVNSHVHHSPFIFHGGHFITTVQDCHLLALLCKLQTMDAPCQCVWFIRSAHGVTVNTHHSQLPLNGKCCVNYRGMSSTMCANAKTWCQYDSRQLLVHMNIENFMFS